jgi:hypothetical protein
METDYTELSDKQLRQMVNDSDHRITDAVATNDRFVLANELTVRGELLRELKRRNTAHLMEAIAKMEDES